MPQEKYQAKCGKTSVPGLPDAKICQESNDTPNYRHATMKKSERVDLLHEDCSGIYGYENFLEAIGDPENEAQHEE